MYICYNKHQSLFPTISNTCSSQITIFMFDSGIDVKKQVLTRIQRALEKKESQMKWLNTAVSAGKLEYRIRPFYRTHHN